ncbi:pseudouridine synthase [Laetiporus sulphureus 93-53]|uniref:Pseudouridine synthase n=1 Tax=Laetiporus sulphureus 93-53 TaxID=1314785 RepID=A0A165E4T0_9APHY|nr:pseudouridine synthase [Laetiporus sulphureus 93-53]KZT06240.1 pseudouridine synthase [Laetiporus sulphureus 93-53]
MSDPYGKTDDSADTAQLTSSQPPKTRLSLKKIPPYWYPHTTMAKGRWLGREILEVVSTEFRDRSMEYYRYALDSGVTTINGKVAKPGTIIQNGDRIENVVHRHEPPVTSTPVRIVHHDQERQFIVLDKPGSIPVHATGRYFRNSLVEILKNDFGLEKVHTINRLDRLTSGLMIIPLSASLANTLSQEFATGLVRKQYVARCKGKFPTEEIICEEPLLTVDRQMGLNIVHPEGKPAKTTFKRLHYDVNTNTSVVHCRPFTGRSHQIRVHLQFLGYPIANDPVYSKTKIWGEKLGKGGLDLTPSDERSAPAPPEQFNLQGADNPESLSRRQPSRTPELNAEPTEPKELPGKTSNNQDGQEEETSAGRPKLLPRETGHDIGLGSPVPLSAEMVGVITRLRNMKDENEDWSRWRDVVFRAKGALSPYGVKVPLPPQNRRKRGGPVHRSVTHEKDDGANGAANTEPEPTQLTLEEALEKAQEFESLQTAESPTETPVLLTPSEFPVPAPIMDESSHTLTAAEVASYCPECYLPLHPDPKPERLYIFLHALRYTTSLGTFETEMPEWASEGFTW